ncbi:MAG: hypothetical protein J6C75_01360 [Oscillospiraceae bacterium]|nr:hypothetical protein [Oscillospiraceae bacterium]
MQQQEQLDVHQLLERLDKSNRQQVKYARLQCLFSAVAAVCCVVLFISVNSLMPQIQALSSQLETVLANLEVVTTQIAELDLKGMVQSAEGDLKTMVQNVDSLVNTSQAGVQETLKKLNSIDFAKLNQAINDLSAVVEQLSRFFNVFR